MTFEAVDGALDEPRSTKTASRSPTKPTYGYSIMKKSVFMAVIIAIVAVGWVMSGEFGGKYGVADKTAGDQAKPEQATSVAERIVKQGQAALTAVRTKSSQARKHWSKITVRGHTEAKRKVVVKSEIKGRITKISVKNLGII